MTHPLTPREKVAEIVRTGMNRLAASQAGARPVVSASKEADRVTDAILTALASGSGDHAELALMANTALEIYSDDVLVVGGTRRIHADNIILYVKNGVDALLAENAALRARAGLADMLGEKLVRRTVALDEAERELSEHRITADLLVSTLKADKEEAERKLAEAVEALEEIAAIEPKPFEGGLDMEAIRACEECRRYEGHPVQHGICDTHRRPIWDREKHEGHEEKALGYRAKSIARSFLSKEAERG